MRGQRRQGAFACAVGVIGLVYVFWSFSTSPELVARPESLEVEDEVACVVEATSTVTCWGSIVDASLELDGGPELFAGVGPLRMAELDDVADVAVDRFGGCALGPQGMLSCWEWLGYGTLFYGDNYLREPQEVDAVPREIVQVPDLPPFESISSGDNICAQQADGAVYCSGLRVAGSQLPGFHEIPVLSGAIDVISGDSEICGRFEDLTVRCIRRRQDNTASDAQSDGAAIVWSGVQWIERSSSRGDSEGWCAGFDDGTTSCSWGSPLDDGLIARDIDGFRGASTAFETNGTLCGVIGAEVRCIDNLGAAGFEQVVRTASDFGEVVTVGSGRTWACVAERGGRVQCLGEARGALGDAGVTGASDTPVVVAESAVPHRQRRLVYALFGGLAALGVWVLFRREPAPTVAA